MQSNVLTTLDSAPHSTWHYSKANWIWHNAQNVCQCCKLYQLDICFSL